MNRRGGASEASDGVRDALPRRRRLRRP